MTNEQVQKSIDSGISPLTHAELVAALRTKIKNAYNGMTNEQSKDKARKKAENLADKYKDVEPNPYYVNDRYSKEDWEALDRLSDLIEALRQTTTGKQMKETGTIDDDNGLISNEFV